MKCLRKYSKNCHMHFGVNLIVDDSNFNNFFVFSLFQNNLERRIKSYYFTLGMMEKYKYQSTNLKLIHMQRCLER